MQHDATNLASIAPGRPGDGIEGAAQARRRDRLSLQQPPPAGGCSSWGETGSPSSTRGRAAPRGRGSSRAPRSPRRCDGRVAQGVRHSSTLHQNLLYVAVPVAAGGVVHGAVRITYPTSAVDARITRYWLILLAIARRRPDAGSRGRHGDRRVRDPSAAKPRTGGRGRRGRRSRRAGSPRTTGRRRCARSRRSSTGRSRGSSSCSDSQNEFVADASHQLRTPLTALRLRLENLEHDLAEPQRRDLEGSLEEVERLARLVDALLVLARADAAGGQTGPVDLARPRERAGRRVVAARRRPRRPARRRRRRRRDGAGLEGRAAPGARQPDRERARGIARGRHRDGERRRGASSGSVTRAPGSRPSSASGRSTASGGPGPARARASASRSCGGWSRPTAATWSWSRRPATVSRPSSGSARRPASSSARGSRASQRAKRSTWSWRRGDGGLAQVGHDPVDDAREGRRRRRRARRCRGRAPRGGAARAGRGPRGSVVADDVLDSRTGGSAAIRSSSSAKTISRARDDAVEDDESPSIRSRSARTGVMPIPPAISSAFGPDPALGGEDPERALGEDTGADRDLAEPRAVVAEALDGDPERVAARRLRERERMLRVPEASGQEAPEEELSRLGAEPLEPAPPIRSETTPGRLVDHLGDPQVEAHGLHERSRDPVVEDERERRARRGCASSRPRPGRSRARCRRGSCGTRRARSPRRR